MVAAVRAAVGRVDERMGEERVVEERAGTDEVTVVAVWVVSAPCESQIDGRFVAAAPGGAAGKRTAGERSGS